MTPLLWVTEREAIAFHDLLIAAHGGVAGLRDRNLLESAQARPLQHLSYGDNPGIPYLAAIYTAGIVQNHPFIDGNKRTGFLVGAVFLEQNGYRLTASEEDAARAVLQLAEGELNVDGYAEFLRTNSEQIDDGAAPPIVI